MKFNTSKQELLKALSVSKRVVDKKTFPILQNAMIKATQNYVTITTTDLERTITVIIDGATTESTGAVCAPAVLLYNIAKSLPDGGVVLHHEDNVLKIYGERGVYYELHTLSVDDFPEIPDDSGVRYVDASAYILTSRLSFVLPFAGIDDPRTYLNSVYWHVDDYVELIATDGYKLAYCYTDYPFDRNRIPKSAIIPRKGAADILYLLQRCDDEIKLGFSKTHVFLETSIAKYTCRLIDAQYPNIDSVIPTKEEISIELSRQDLLEAIERVAVIAKDNKALNFRFTRQKLTITAQSTEVGNASQTLGVIDYNGDKEEFGLVFNADNLSTVLRSFKSETIIMDIDKPDTPVRILSNHDVGWTLVMPMGGES